MYPKKYAVTQDDVVVGLITVEDPNASAGAPPGMMLYEIPINSPVQIGWHHSFDDEAQQDVWTAPV